jgi:AcrR family transcriptional regulator
MSESQDRRELILTSAAEMFARKGIGATTVREIADAVGVLSGSLYHHFESKDAIVDEILTGYLDAIRGQYAAVLASDNDPADCLHQLVLTSLQVAEDQPYATAIYQNELHYLREQARFKDIQVAAADVQRTWLQVIEKGVADGTFRDDIAPRVFYRLIRDAVWLSVRWHRPDGAYPTEQLADDVTSIFLTGFSAGARTGRRRPAKATSRPRSKRT